VEGGLKEAREKELLIARMAVEKTIESVREMARDGRIKQGGVRVWFCVVRGGEGSADIGAYWA
jgi:hypothetical protein